MRLQVSTDYAIRILHYLHVHRKDLSTAMTISQSIGITYPFFIKIANQLKKKGLLKAIQGRNGGYHLARPGEEISLYDVFWSIEGDLALNRCLHDDKFCSRTEPENCEFHHYFQELQEQVIGALSGKTIADFAHS
ncbi:MAG: Rrf2 family transcriptional regulator [Oscillospiraceae bacterium]|nr:Rrf2 family transcriptional regulator [Oscillospiraceae bacterium]